MSREVSELRNAPSVVYLLTWQRNHPSFFPFLLFVLGGSLQCELCPLLAWVRGRPKHDQMLARWHPGLPSMVLLPSPLKVRKTVED